MSEYRIGLEDLCIGLYRKIEVKEDKNKCKNTREQLKGESDRYRKESKE